MIGTRGVPARYGGFETAIEEIGSRLVQMGHEVIVFCRPVAGQPRPSSHHGMRLVWLPAVRKSSLETLSHTALSVVSRELVGVDAAIVFNSANAPLLPVLRARGIPVATHVDGLEWKRAKWGPVGRRYYRVAERLAVRWSDALIADAQGIADYYAQKFGAETYQIAYGAPILDHVRHDRLDDLGLTPHGYHLVVARFEPENHVREIVQGYVASAARKPLVVVGSAPYADAYIQEVRSVADDRVRFLGSVWDQQQLDQLYANCLTYLHGHSVGGTNPSLLRAAGAGAPVLVWDVDFNREVVGANGRFFGDADDVRRLVEESEATTQEEVGRGNRLRDAIRRYDWDDVAIKYAELCTDLIQGATGRPVAVPDGPKILVAAPSAELYGSDRMVIESVKGLVSAGARVTVTTPVDGPLLDRVRAAGAEVVSLPVPVLRKSALRPLGAMRLATETVRTLPGLIRATRKYGRDGIYVNTLTVPSWLMAARLGRVRSTCHVHEAEASAPGWIRRMLNLPLLLADDVLVNSRFSARVLNDSLSRMAPTTCLVPNGVDGPPVVVPAREQLDSPVRLLFLGRLSPRKGPDVAVDAARILADRGVDVQLTLLGGVFEGYEWFERQLRSRAGSDPDGRIEFAGYNSDIWPWLAKTDIVLVPSTVDEPFGNTAVEAILATRPLVVSDTSGLREAADGYEAAVSFSPGDPVALADAVEKVIANWAQFSVAVERDRSAASARHSPDRFRQTVALRVLGRSVSVAAS